MLYWATESKLYFQYTGDSVAKLFKAKNEKADRYIKGGGVPSYPLTASGSKKVVYEIFENDFNLSLGTFDDSNLYTLGNSGSTSYPKYTVPEAGSYVFAAEFDLTIQFGTTQQSGSYTFQMVKNGSVIKQQTLAYTGSAQLFIDESFSYFDLSSDFINQPFLSVTPITTTQALIYEDINGVQQILPVGSILYKGDGYTNAAYCYLGAANPGAPQVDPAFLPTSSAYTLVDPLSHYNSSVQKCDTSPFYNTGDTQYNRFDLTNNHMYSLTTGSSLITTQTFNVQSDVDNYTSGDVIEFRFIENGMSTSNYTASLSEGELQVQLQSNFSNSVPFATSSVAPFISGSVSPDELVLNTSLSGFIGYQFLPDGSASGSVSSSLYSTYGEVDYTFSPKNGDLMIVQYHGSSNEFKINGYQVSGSKALITVTPALPTAFTTAFIPSDVEKVLFLTKVKDEQNVILKFQKRDGATSYGLIIPDNIHPDVLANIDTIASEIKTKLIEVGQLSGSF
jgi:hypothetical protein